MLAAALSVVPPESAPVTRAAEPSSAPTDASAAPQPAGFDRPKSFRSERFGYSIRYPPRWTVEPSESDSSPDSVVSPDGPRLTIVRRTKSDDSPLAPFVDAAFSKRCHRAESVPKLYHVDPGPPAFEHRMIDGHPAFVRGYCWRVDGVVDLDDEILMITLEGGQVGPRGGRWTFDWLAERIDVDASPKAPESTPESESPQQFDSTRYGYSIRYPSGWVPFPSDRAGLPDVFRATVFATAPESSRLSISRRPKEVNQTLRQIAEQTLPFRSQLGRCRWGMPAGEQEFHGSRIVGRAAVVRSACGYIDAVIDAGGDVLVVALRSGWQIPTHDRLVFDQFMDTLDIELSPEGTSSADPSPGFTWTEQFTSDRYGYSIRHPPGWIPGHVAEDGSTDEFYAPVGSKTRLSIVRRPKPDGMTLDEIALDVFPARSGSHGCHTDINGTVFYIPSAPQPFDKATIAGRSALVRSECGFVDAVIDDAEDVLLVVLRSGTHNKATGDRWNFDRFMETLEINPSAS
jgi:hypothetical protein